MAETEKELTLYLAAWQKRMMRDFMSKEQLKQINFTRVTQIIFKPPKKWCLASYKIPPEGIRKGDWVIYLTDEQMAIVSTKLNLRAPVSSINITDSAIKDGIISFA